MNSTACGKTRSEKFVAYLCENSFLKLWTHPNPKGKNNKELCDCLIVCGPHVIIISVKECNYKLPGGKIEQRRWSKAAIKKSVSQIYGAERWLNTATQVMRHDGREITLPPREKRIYHRISVSLGGKGLVSIQWGDFGNGFVHVYDEYSVNVAFFALDTVTDFVEFLSDCEELVRDGAILAFAGCGVESLIAIYLSQGHSFAAYRDHENKPYTIILTGDMWKGFSESPDYKKLLKNNESSYMWDNLLNFFIGDLLTGGMFDMHSKEVTTDELALVEMALQPRRYRAVLAESLMTFLQSHEPQIKSRIVKGYKNTAFVFLIGKSAEREIRVKELGLRCYVVRAKLPHTKTVVGIAMDRPGTSEIGYAADIAYIHIPHLAKDEEERIATMQKDLGYFLSL